MKSPPSASDRTRGGAVAPVDETMHLPRFLQSSFWTRWVAEWDRIPRNAWVVLAGSLLIGIGTIDYATGYEVSAVALYLLPISIAAWFAGPRWGAVIAVGSVLSGVLTNWAGNHIHSPLVLAWNIATELGSFLLIVFLLSSLKLILQSLEQRVRQKTEALQAEIVERERLQAEILRVSENEQRRIGHDLHDVVCQHLTGTALACQVHKDKLESRGLPEAENASLLVAMVEEGIGLARNLAKGLSSLKLEEEGFSETCRQFAEETSRRHRISCRFEEDEVMPLLDHAFAVHLYRIVQEAVNNAIRHGRPKAIAIRWFYQEECPTLSIVDDGTGLPSFSAGPSGLGLRIMAYRASMIGAGFRAEKAAPRGTRILCTLNPGTESTHGKG